MEENEVTQGGIKQIRRNTAEYPRNVELCLGVNAPEALFTIGETGVLDSPLTALFCSSKCPGSVILKTYDLAQKLRSEGRTVISSFHSPMERQCLDILLRSPHPVVIVPARGLTRMRVPVAWRPAIDEGRLLLLSMFGDAVHRATAAQAVSRNRLVAAMADEVVIAHAAAGGRAWRLAQDACDWGKRVLTADDAANEELIDAGAQRLG
jgi:predicted Rossmann fold nucleotide-binding protein DprA/Smf involved in DNA uptake